MNDKRLAFILRAPAVVERVVRGALREALRSRRYHSGALDVRMFANAALSELDRIAGDMRLNLDPFGRLELENATVNAAGCFASSALARRLFDLPLERFRSAPPEIDAAILDSQHHRHLVRLELVSNAAARSDLARAIARDVGAAEDARHFVSLHFLSIRDGRLRSFGATDSRVVRNAAVFTARPEDERTA